MPALPPSLSAFAQAILRPRVVDLQFAIKAVLAGGIALYLAFVFQLQQPQWALVTVFVVSQPLSGMVLAKSVFRLLGTLTGAAMSVALVAWLGQAPLPFLLAMALWLAFCTAGASMLRNFSSYGFVLAGYTAAIVALPASAAPLTVFDQAVARCSEIGLGIACASLVSVLLWPRSTEQQLLEQARKVWSSTLKAASAEMLGTDEHAALIATLGSILELDGRQEQAWFEGPTGRRRVPALRGLNAALLGLLRAARRVAREGRLLDAAVELAVRPWRELVRECLENAQQPDFTACREHLLGALENAAGAQERDYLESLLAVLDRGRQSRRSLEALLYGEATREAPALIVWHRDVERGLLFGLRSALAFLCVAGFWVVSAWPSGLGAVSITGVVLSLFASRDEPAGAGLNFLRGILLSIPVAAVAVLVILPRCEGFTALYSVLGIPLFIAALCTTRPAIAAMASAFCIFFVKNVGPSNQMVYDLDHFLNSALATVLGVGFAVLVFNLVELRPGRRHYRRVLGALLADLARLTRGPLPRLEAWFDGRSADRLLRLVQYQDGLPPERRAQWRGGLFGLALADELLFLRDSLGTARGPLRRARDSYLARLRQLLLDGGPRNDREHALDGVEEALSAALQGNRWLEEGQRRRARAAVGQLRSIWLRWCREAAADAPVRFVTLGATGRRN
nr:FUSC family protein [uncultured Pseudomonas sp.]